MQSTENRSWLAPIIIVSISLLLFSTVSYISSDLTQRQPATVVKEFDYAGRPIQPLTMPNQLVLSTGERLVLEKHALVYRGIVEKKIIVDLYILALDPQQPYEQKIEKSEAKKGFTLGDMQFKLVTAKSKHLILKHIPPN